MTQTKLDRLRARGTVVIEADADGYTVSWWPTGQKGNPFCGRGGKGPAMEPLVAELEKDTRPPTRDWDDARYWRERQVDRDDRLRERRVPAP